MFGEEFYFTFTQICFGVIGSGFSAASPLTSGVGGAGIVSFQATAGVDLYLVAVVGGNVYNVYSFHVQQTKHSIQGHLQILLKD